jgi:hypothetical protein
MIPDIYVTDMLIPLRRIYQILPLNQTLNAGAARVHSIFVPPTLFS